MENSLDIQGTPIKIGSQVIVDTYVGIGKGEIADITKNTIQVELLDAGLREVTRTVDRKDSTKCIYVIK